MRHKTPLYERFLTFVVKLEDCWEWSGYVDNHGYGRIMTDRGPVRAHRVSYVLHHGEVPGGQYVLHHCDNRKCVNPTHLYVGTHSQNMRDKVQRGRAFTGDAKGGEAHGRAKLTDEQVYKIRASDKPNPTLARQYGVTPSAIGLIKRRKTWVHLTEKENKL